MGNDDFDELLKSALHSYRAEQPRAGLEKRVLAGVEARKRWTVLGWAAVLLPVALALAVVCDWPSSPVERLNLPLVRRPDVPLMPVAVQPVVQHRHHKTLPKLEQFPRRTPLSNEERLLLAVAKNPELAKGFIRNDDPLDIKPIVIPELNSNSEKGD